jgi:polyribonucleotide nucleotidyltransferase
VARATEVAEKVVLVPVGAGLIARERLMEVVEELRSTYSTRKKTESELQRYERRATSALKSVERDVKAALKDIDSRTAVTKQVELVSARVENAVQGGKTAATKATTAVQERIAAMV